VTVGGLDRPDTLHPLLAKSEAARAVLPLLFDSLLAYDPDSGQLIPHLAESWKVSGDSRAITFTLRSAARWHDGQPVVADDVVFTIETARDPALNSLYGPQLEPVVEVKAPNHNTVEIRLAEADCPSLGVLGELPILPRHVLARPGLDSAAFGSAPLGSGPFSFVDWESGGELRLAANDDYWGGAPFLAAWSYRPFETTAELQQALEREQIDAALLPPGSLLDAGNLPASLSVYRYPAPEFLFVAFNNDYPVLADAQARRALSMAIDREQLLGEALGGAGELIPGSLPAAHWAADPALQPPAYDPGGARRLLAEAGWSDTDGDGWLDRDGERLRLPVRTNAGNRLREDVARLVAGYYRAIGVEASAELVVWGAVVDDLFTHDFEAIVFSWPLPAEPDQSRWWLSTENQIGSGYNFVSFADPEVDRLLQEAAILPGCDTKERAVLYQQIQGLLAQQRPYDFLLVPYAALVMREGIKGAQPGPFASPFWNAAEWYISAD
jgi:peptide/nickel transport system substrate-binding protein